jgi:hypothetical protein
MPAVPSEIPPVKGFWHRFDLGNCHFDTAGLRFVDLFFMSGACSQAFRARVNFIIPMDSSASGGQP